MSNKSKSMVILWIWMTNLLNFYKCICHYCALEPWKEYLLEYFEKLPADSSWALACWWLLLLMVLLLQVVFMAGAAGYCIGGMWCCCYLVLPLYWFTAGKYCCSCLEHWFTAGCTSSLSKICHCIDLLPIWVLPLLVVFVAFVVFADGG